MSDWAEVRRLAADFQRLQAASTAHRLSERNCVELVSRLVERRLVEVIYTLDGKEYVTPEQLEREIKSELTAHGGRRRGGDVFVCYDRLQAGNRLLAVGVVIT